MNKNTILQYGCALVLGILWPLFQILLYVVRFYSLPEDLVTSLLFYPMGVLSFVFFIYLYKLLGSHNKQKLVFGYLFASPVAAVFSLLGSLIIDPFIGTTLMGLIPLMVGSFWGYKVTIKKLNSKNKGGIK